MKTLLIVDDEDTVRSSLELLLKGQFNVETAKNGREALDIVEKTKTDLVLLDVMMPELDGIETLRKLQSRSPEIPVIMLTAGNTVKTAVEAMKLGAKDYLNKPFDVEELTSIIVNTLESVNEEQPIQSTSIVQSKPASHDVSNIEIVGSSSVFSNLLEQVDLVASRDTTVLVTGESGVGKELIAKRIHANSSRSAGPFVPINCAAIPESLIESELFGHEKGAFTSAIEQRIGHFELADGGTLFLDEIGELSLSVQVKMLRFLQEQEFIRVGSSQPRKVDVRVIAATHRKLEDLVKEKRFRQDLYYRVNVINLEVPPLRERYEDVSELIDYFLAKFAPAYGDRAITFAPEVTDLFREYDWPGNVRELENVIESLLALSPEDKIELEMIPSRIRERESSEPVQFRILDKNLNFEEAEKHFETEIILKALKKTNYIQTRAADLLGISRRILKYKMDKLGISAEGESEKVENVPEELEENNDSPVEEATSS